MPNFQKVIDQLKKLNSNDWKRCFGKKAPQEFIQAILQKIFPKNTNRTLTPEISAMTITFCGKGDCEETVPLILLTSTCTRYYWWL